MKLLIQRVNNASVSVVFTGKVVGKIDKGLFILVGIKKEDSEKNADELIEKLIKLRVMADEKEKMNLSIIDTTRKVLLVSQFTLYADTKGGNRPSFIEAEEPEKAKKLYQYFISRLKEKGIKVETGEFGEYMNINLSLDGPVTISLEY